MFERTLPKVSIIIPSWFKPGQDGKYCANETYWFAQECLKRLYAVTSGVDYETIIIDNGSTLTNEDVAAQGFNILPSEYWQMADVLVRNKVNLGFGPACNQGFALARGEYILCLNNDVLVWPGWLTTMVNEFEAEPSPIGPELPPIGILMPALMRETRDAKEAIALEKIDLKSNFNEMGMGAEFGSLWMMPRRVHTMLMQRDGYVFDENFKLGMGEDRDLWDRVRTLGFQTYRTHKVRIFHQGNMSIGKVPDRKDYTLANREYLAKLREERNKNI